MADTAKVIEVLEKVAGTIEENMSYLTDLDAAIGDSDHGINLNRGFKKVMEKLPALREKDVGTVLKQAGMALVSSVGGASGPLYGTAFMKAGQLVQGKREVGLSDFVGMLGEAINGIETRGKAVQCEKTMLDALIPAVNAVRDARDDGKSAREAMDAGVAAAKEGVEYTKTIIATKGRASYLGERSIGHQDPGATSSMLILKAIAECF